MRKPQGGDGVTVLEKRCVKEPRGRKERQRSNEGGEERTRGRSKGSIQGRKRRPSERGGKRVKEKKRKSSAGDDHTVASLLLLPGKADGIIKTSAGHHCGRNEACNKARRASNPKMAAALPSNSGNGRQGDSYGAIPSVTSWSALTKFA